MVGVLPERTTGAGRDPTTVATNYYFPCVLFIFYLLIDMVERLVTKLRLTPEEAYNFSITETNKPNIMWLQWEKPDIVIAEFTGTDLQPLENKRRTMSDIKSYVQNKFRGRIVDADLRSHYLSPKIGLGLRVIRDHPLVSGNGVPIEVKRAADSAKEVQQVGLTRAQVEHIKKTTKQSLPVKEVRKVEKGFSTSLPSGEQVKTSEGMDDLYMVEQVLIDSG